MSHLNNSHLNILFIHNSFEAMGGAVIRTVGLLKNFNKYGADVSILTTSISKNVYKYVKSSNISKIYYVKIRSLRDISNRIPTGFDIVNIIKMMLICIKYIKNNKCDLIYIRPHPENMLAVLLSSIIMKKPFIIELHHSMVVRERLTIFRFLVKKIENILINTASKVVVNSQVFRDELISMYGKNIEKKINVVYNGVDTKQFRIYKRKLSKPRTSSEPLIGFIGSLKKEEDLLSLVKAANLVIKKYPRIIFSIVGKDLGLKSELEKEIELYGLKDNFLLIGERPFHEIPSILKDFSVFVAPRVSDERTRLAMPIKILEAMVAEVPVISTTLPPIIELVGNAAILVPPGDYLSLAREIVIILENSSLRDRIVKDAYKIAIKFDWKNIEPIFFNVLWEAYLSYGKGK